MLTHKLFTSFLALSLLIGGFEAPKAHAIDPKMIKFACVLGLGTGMVGTGLYLIGKEKKGWFSKIAEPLTGASLLGLGSLAIFFSGELSNLELGNKTIDNAKNFLNWLKENKYA